MRNLQVILLVLFTSGWFCAGTLPAEQGYLPESTSKAPLPIPMTVFKIPNFKAKPGDDAAIGLINTKPVDHGEVAVRFKTLATEGEQEAGIAFRYKDPQNYYVIVASAKDESCALYRVRDGKRKMINSGDAIVTPLTWHELRVTFVQDNYTAILDGELVLGVKDSSFKDAGLVGLWAKTGSQFVFDNLRVSHP